MFINNSIVIYSFVGFLILLFGLFQRRRKRFNIDVSIRFILIIHRNRSGLTNLVYHHHNITDYIHK